MRPMHKLASGSGRDLVTHIEITLHTAKAGEHENGFFDPGNLAEVGLPSSDQNADYAISSALTEPCLSDSHSIRQNK